MSWLFPWAVALPTPLGPLVVEGQGGVRSARFDPSAALGGEDPLGVGRALAAWFAGDLRALDAIPVDPKGTDFQRRVWQALVAIPPGETRTYGELAAGLGSVPRAVGGAVAANPAALFVPCHRVVGAGDALTGYAWGVERKAWLLDHERGENPLLPPRGMTGA